MCLETRTCALLQVFTDSVTQMLIAGFQPPEGKEPVRSHGQLVGRKPTQNTPFCKSCFVGNVGNVGNHRGSSGTAAHNVIFVASLLTLEKSTNPKCLH